jgi:hypothetical protein
MKVKQFVETCIEIANSPTVYYSVAGGDWCKWNGTKWNMDCVCMIKGILWGFNFNKNASHGGAIYGSNGVYDDNADGIMRRCTSISRDFRNTEYGEILHMDGHVGVYIGDGKVVESTAWYGKTIISNVATDGNRIKDGKSGGYWKEHGKLQYIDYSDAPKPTPQPTPSNKIEIGSKVKITTMSPYKYWVADDVQIKYGIYQIREDVNAGNDFDWRDNGIPEMCVDLVHSDGRKRSDSDFVHAQKGDKFVFAKTFTVTKIAYDNNRKYFLLDFDGNADHRFWVIGDYLRLV